MKNCERDVVKYVRHGTNTLSDTGLTREWRDWRTLTIFSNRRDPWSSNEGPELLEIGLFCRRTQVLIPRTIQLLALPLVFHSQIVHPSTLCAYTPFPRVYQPMHPLNQHADQVDSSFPPILFDPGQSSHAQANYISALLLAFRQRPVLHLRSGNSREHRDTVASLPLSP